MTTKFFIDANGKYLGGFTGAKPPDGAIEIDKPPAHGWDVYDRVNETWIPYVPEVPLLDELSQMVRSLPEDDQLALVPALGGIKVILESEDPNINLIERAIQTYVPDSTPALAAAKAAALTKVAEVKQR